MPIHISKSIRSSYPSLPYQKIKDAILGKGYMLSLVFIGTKRAHTLNKKHRKASYIPNVLSFPLTKSVGDIYITPDVARKEAHRYHMTPRGYIGYLFIHGLLHLKGYPHGATMDTAEKKYTTRFGLR